jgi:hypothetical protein
MTDASNRPGTCCHACGRSLRGISFRRRCPGCRTPVRESVGNPAFRFLDPDTCSCCGYSLLGLPSWRDPEAKCPECGVEMVRARLGSDLPAADPASLRRLALGMRRVNLGIGASILMPVFGLLAMVAISSLADLATGRDLSSSRLFEVVGSIVIVGGLALGFVLWCLGWWAVAGAFEDRRLAGSRGGVVRALRIVNLSSVGGVLAAIVSSAIPLPASGSGLPAALSALAVALLFATATLGLVLFRGVAKRTTRHKLRRGMTQLIWTSPLLVIGPAVIAYQAVFGGVRADEWAGLLNCFALIWAISFLSFVGQLDKIIRGALAEMGAPDDTPARPGADAPPSAR